MKPFQFEGSNTSMRHYRPLVILPSEQRAHGGSVHFGLGHQTFASAMLFSNDSKPKNTRRTTGKCGRECSLATGARFLISNLVLIWNRWRLARYHGTSCLHPLFLAGPNPSRPSKLAETSFGMFKPVGWRYVSYLRAWEVEAVKMADGEPYQYIVPMLRAYLKSHYHEFREKMDAHTEIYHCTPLAEQLSKLRLRRGFLDGMHNMVEELLYKKAKRRPIWWAHHLK